MDYVPARRFKPLPLAFGFQCARDLAKPGCFWTEGVRSRGAGAGRMPVGTLKVEPGHLGSQVLREPGEFVGAHEDLFAPRSHFLCRHVDGGEVASERP